MSFVKTGAFRGLNSSSDDLKIDSSGNVAIVNGNIVNKNLLINGGMHIWQRNTSASVSSDIFATVDRWQNGIGGLGVFTVSRSTDVPAAQGFGYSCKYDCTTADASPAAGDYAVHYQKIEGYNLQHLLKGTSSAKKVTVSFWVKSNKTGTYILDLFDNDNSRHISKAYTIDTASTWEKKEITFEGDTSGAIDNDNSASLNINWWLGSGSNHTSGTLATSWATRVQANVAPGQVNLADSASNEWYMTGCQVEIGEQATGFEFESPDTVIEKCMRYFEHSYPDGNFPGVTITVHGMHHYSWGDTPGPWFKVKKRGVPTVTLYPTSSTTTGQTTNGGTNRSSTAQNVNERGVSYIAISGGTTTWNRYNWKADAEL